MPSSTGPSPYVAVILAPQKYSGTGDAGTFTSTRLDSPVRGVPPLGVPTIVATLMSGPAAVSRCVHVNVVEAPGATGVAPGPPAIVPVSHWPSSRPEKASATLPVFFTVI